MLGEDVTLFAVCAGRFEAQLELPHLPDMIFADNCLRLVHENGFGIEFTTLDALKRVGSEQDIVQVANAKAWKEARPVFFIIRFCAVNSFNYSFNFNVYLTQFRSIS